MKNYILIFSIITGLLFLNSCSKDDDDDVQPTPTTVPTSLELTLKDNLGNSVSGASVKLYSSESDWENETNQIGSTQTSDASGKVKFNDLSNIKYYWLAKKDCQNNVNGAVTTTSELTANTVNSLNVILSSTGTLRFVSTSTNPYRIFINGTAAFEMAGGTTENLFYVPTGSYSIRVLQLSGYVFTPTDQTYTANVGCGQTITTTFP